MVQATLGRVKGGGNKIPGRRKASGSDASSSWSDPELCPPCLNPLAHQQLGVGVDSEGQRVCSHYFHLVCLRRVKPRRCPQCRAPFARAQALPNIVEESSAWCAAVSLSGSEGPDKQEVACALRAMLPMSPEDVHELVSERWSDWSHSKERLDGGALESMVATLQPLIGDVEPAPPQEESDHDEESDGHSRRVPGAVCQCGKIHAQRGDRVQRGPAWAGSEADGGEGHLGTIVRDEEDSSLVFVKWDRDDPDAACHAYAWPSEPSQHAVQHAAFEAIAPDVQELQESTGLSSAAAQELLRRGYALGEACWPAEASLRQPLRLYHRCRVLPDKEKVQAWFAACPPCNCSRPNCSGGLRWSEGAERHLGREGYVVKEDNDDDTVLVSMSGRCCCKVWYPRLAVQPVFDPDTSDLPRFKVGSSVECRMEDSWHKGTVERIWWRPVDWGNRPTMPYLVTIEGGRKIGAPRDCDQVIRAC